jgi:hypothetical protein
MEINIHILMGLEALTLFTSEAHQAPQNKQISLH